MSDKQESKKLLIITGPQGSGNHLFSKVFSYHSDVVGWDFGDKYWIPSDEEPFAECWVDPSKTKSMLTQQYMVANVSVPFVFDGVKQVPQIQEVVYEAEDAGYEVRVCIVVRDENINRMQQFRVRKEITLQTALQYYYNLDAETEFLSVESLYLYRAKYLKWLSKVLDFPIAWFDERIEDTLKDNQNEKYVKRVKKHWLDEQVWNGIKPKNER